MTEHRINIMGPDVPVQTVGTAAAEPSKIIYASVSERFIALLIDYGIIFIPGHLISQLIFKMLGDEIELWHCFASVAIVNLLFVLYEAIFSSGDRVTLGKSLVGIAVVRKDLEGPISFPRAFLRAIGYYISGGLFFCGFLLSFFDDKHRALHDFLAGSVVVQIRQKAGWERWLMRLLGSLLLFTFAWTAYTQYFAGGKFVQMSYIRQARAHLYKIAVLEEAHYALYGYYTNDLLRLSLLSGDPVQFQRDTHKALEPKGFKIGIKGNTYKISALAKDQEHTRVVFSPTKE